MYIKTKRCIIIINMKDINSNVDMIYVKKHLIATELKTEQKKLSQTLYNSKYYALNKQAINKKFCKKVQCSLCSRPVILHNLKKHQLSKNCEKTQKF